MPDHRSGYCTAGVLLSFLAILPLPTAGLAGQLDFGTYKLLQRGMSEGEVLTRAGQPDKEYYFDSEPDRTAQSIKQYLYIPGPEESDPQLTVITIQMGRVLNIERTKILSPPKRRTGGQIDTDAYRQLKTGMSVGEVLARVGDPDREVPINDSEEQLLYIPGPNEHDPQLTTITIQNGRVIDINRKKVLSR